MTETVGSWAYMAPEVTLGQPYNEKVDVFSFGMVLFEVLSRKLLLLDEIKEDPRREARAYAERVARGFRPVLPRSWPPALRELLTACWAQVRRRRRRGRGVSAKKDSSCGYSGHAVYSAVYSAGLRDLLAYLPNFYFVLLAKLGDVTILVVDDIFILLQYCHFLSVLSHFSGTPACLFNTLTAPRAHLCRSALLLRPPSLPSPIPPGASPAAGIHHHRRGAHRAAAQRGA